MKINYKFSRKMYLADDWSEPLTGTIFVGVTIIIHIIAFIFNGLSEDGLGEGFIAINQVIIFITCLKNTLRGYPLLKDSESDCFAVVAEIEKIEYVKMGTIHRINGDMRQSIYITIDGGKYYSVSLPGIHVGDEVTLFVLKNSKFVIECEREKVS